jgi:multisubunit Na+/H+ antiporter MnhC subunit
LIGFEDKPGALEGRVTNLPISSVVLTTGFVLFLIGLWGILTHRNIFRIIISFSLIGTGTHLVMVAIGYVAKGTAPIIDRALSLSEASSRAVDPIPAALVVTAIVIGLAVTAVMLAYAIRLYESKKTFSIDAFAESKW